MYWIDDPVNNIRLNLDLAVSIEFSSDTEADVKMFDGSTYSLASTGLRHLLTDSKKWASDVTITTVP